MSRAEVEFLSELRENLGSKGDFIQVILGPRQVGKTTGILSFLESLDSATKYFSADEELAPDGNWLKEKWQAAVSESDDCVLVIDEIQKIQQWSAQIKKLWDERVRKKQRIQLILLGSSSLQIQTGLQESLTGRFQLIRAHHWGYASSKTLQKMDLETFVKMGGYPGSYSLISKPTQWQKYIRDSIVETVIGKDILQLARVNKPALFRQCFSLLMSYPAQEISYTKLLGQLQDQGNTDLVKSYIELFEGAFLMKALQKYSTKAIVKKTSSPRIIPLCGALIDRETFESKDGFGRAFEAAVGATLINQEIETFYWRDGSDEVDFVIKFEKKVIAIEVKSGRKKTSRGLNQFTKNFPQAETIFITEENGEKFFLDPKTFLKKLI